MTYAERAHNHLRLMDESAERLIEMDHSELKHSAIKTQFVQSAIRAGVNALLAIAVAIESGNTNG